VRRGLFRELTRYVATGGAAALVDSGVFATMLRVGLGTAVAGSFSFCIAAVVNFLLTSRFVFAEPATLRRFRLFFLGALAGMAINVSVTVAVVAALAWPPLLCKIIGIGTAFIANFAINALIVFRAAPAQRLGAAEPGCASGD
jgi:putative flippase GtrA